MTGGTSTLSRTLFTLDPTLLASTTSLGRNRANVSEHVHCNLESIRSARAAIRLVEFSQWDVLALFAGVDSHLQSHELTYRTYRNIMITNCYSQLQLAVAIARRVGDRPFHIVMASSSLLDLPESGSSLYVMSKAALEQGLTVLVKEAFPTNAVSASILRLPFLGIRMRQDVENPSVRGCLESESMVDRNIADTVHQILCRGMESCAPRVRVISL